MQYIFLVGRILFSLIFLIKPLEHFSNLAVLRGAEMGVPAPHFWVPLWGVIAFLGGLSLLLGFKAKIGAWLLVLFLIPTTLYMHPFWGADDSFASMMHGYCFWKNISLLGTALMIAYMGSGPCSLETAKK